MGMNDDQLGKFMKKLSPDVVVKIKGDYDDLKIALSNATDQIAALKSMMIHLRSMIDEIFRSWNRLSRHDLFYDPLGSSISDNPPRKSGFMGFKEFPKHWCNVAFS